MKLRIGRIENADCSRLNRIEVYFALTIDSWAEKLVFSGRAVACLMKYLGQYYRS